MNFIEITEKVPDVQEFKGERPSTFRLRHMKAVNNHVLNPRISLDERL